MTSTQTKLTFAKRIIGALTTMVVVACGGGGGGAGSGGSYVAYISDRYNNQPAVGATISVTATGECSISSPATYTVPNNNAPYAYSAAIEIGSVANDATTVDSVTVSISNPGGSAVSQTFVCTP